MASARGGKRRKTSTTCKKYTLEVEAAPNLADLDHGQPALDVVGSKKDAASKWEGNFVWLDPVPEGADSGGNQSGAAYVVPPLGAYTTAEPPAKPADDKRKEARTRKVEEERKINDLLECFQRRAKTTASPTQERSMGASASSSSSSKAHVDSHTRSDQETT